VLTVGRAPAVTAEQHLASGLETISKQVSSVQDLVLALFGHFVFEGGALQQVRTYYGRSFLGYL
jgi:hypothetical protein